jgi:hypothetical protein
MSNYDVAYRYQQALDPSALIILPAALHALSAAIEDCRNAGRRHDSDPAVILLARHLGTIAAQTGAADAELRRACMDAIADLLRKPALIALAHTGVAYDERAKRRFHRDARTALVALADALGLPDGSYDIRSNRGPASISGEVMMHGDSLYVRLSIGTVDRGREVLFRKVASRQDHIGERNHWASVAELLNAPGLAARIRRELNLPAPDTGSALLAA